MSLPTDAGALVAWMNRLPVLGIPSVVAGLDGVVDGVLLDGRVLSLEEFLGRVSVTSAVLLLPVPGDTAGLPVETVGASAAAHLTCADAAWIVLPPGVGERWWTAVSTHATAMPPTDPAEARRVLARVMREAAEVLESYGLERGDDRLSQRLAQVDRDLDSRRLPWGMDVRVPALIEQATRLLAVTDLALETEGASVTSRESTRRSEILREVSRAARGALTSAYSWTGTVNR